MRGFHSLVGFEMNRLVDSIGNPLLAAEDEHAPTREIDPDLAVG